MRKLKTQLKKRIETLSDSWMSRQPAWLGRSDTTVETGIPGLYYARLINGNVERVLNTANVPPTYDLPVIIGTHKDEPSVPQIIGARQVYLTPVERGQVAYHEKQHRLGAGDALLVDRKQITSLTVIVADAAGFIVQVYGALIRTSTGLSLVNNQRLDLSSYVQTIGAVFLNIETDDAGTISINPGTPFESSLAATPADIPVPDVGKYLIATVLLYEGQTELLDSDIRVPMPLESAYHGDMRKSEYDADDDGVVDDANKLGGELPSAYLLVNDLFDDAEGDPADVTSGMAADGTSEKAARRDHVHHIDLEPVGQYRQFVYTVSGGDLTFLTDETGLPLFMLEDLE